MRKEINFSLTVTDNHHHTHKVKGISKKDSYTTTLTLDDGAVVTLVDRDIESRDLIQIVGVKGCDYFITITKE
jgi:hypothetical protein